MNNRGRSTLQSLKQEKDKTEMPSGRPMNPSKPITTRRSSIKERKIALQQDLDKLKKRLRHEENVHRALERAFTRPLGSLPRLPSYLPSHTLELLAEVAVLEEEVVRLEEKVVRFRQGLYQEAVYSCSSSKKNTHESPDRCNNDQVKYPKTKELKPSNQCEAVHSTKKSLSVSDELERKENKLGSGSSKIKVNSPNLKGQSVRTPSKRATVACKSVDRRLNPQKLQFENRDVMDNDDSSAESNTVSTEDKNLQSDDNNPNKISESILKCLMNIFSRMSSKKSRSISEALNSSEMLVHTEFKDPYGICSKFGNRDIGPYKNLVSIEATSISCQSKTTISVFLLQRLKHLLEKLATVDLKGLTHQEKLAFWINIYNSCLMNAFIEYGVPESPEMVVALMQKATVNVSGHTLNAITIEHFILRLPYHSKHTFSKGAKSDEMTARTMFGLELSEPLVTFALSCGSWSSPEVRVYTASQVETELETAKRDYLHAAIGISTAKKVIAVPKLLDWYLLDFAKDIESLVDWICLQLPSELRKEAMRCLERRKDEAVTVQVLHIMPYDFSFRYLLKT